MSQQQALDAAEAKADELIRKLQAGEPIESLNADEPVEEQKEQAPPEEKPEESLEYWKNRFLTVDGKLKAEVPALSQELASYRTDNATLRAELMELKAKIDQKREEKAPDPIPDYVDYVKEQFPEVDQSIDYKLDRKLQERLAEFDRKLATVQKTFVEKEGDSFKDKLTSKVEDWETLNGDKEFLSWLETKEKYARKSRLELLREAVRDHDAQSAAEFFTDFKKEKGKGPNIEKFASPPKGSSGNVILHDNEAAPITRDFMVQFHEDYTKGRYKGREKEADLIEKRIDAALAAGKIT